MKSIEAFVEEGDTKEALRRAHRDLAKAKASREELVQAVYQAVQDGVRTLQIDKVRSPSPDRRSKDPEVAVAILSDFQLAKVTRTYNTQVCADRVKLYGEKVRRLTTIQRADHPVKQLRVWLLGDVLEGEMIFPGQAHLIDASLYKQLVYDGPKILSEFLRQMLQEFETIHVTGVIGNHGSFGGRLRREYNPTTNADRMLYAILRLIFQDEKRITWNIPDLENERDWYAIDKIGSKSWLLCHGDQFKWGIKTPSAEQKVLGWHSGAVPEKFDEVVCGHWHNMNLITLKGSHITLRCNGTTESYNTYAQEHVGSMGRPAQWLLFAHEKQGITAEYRVFLD